MRAAVVAAGLLLVLLITGSIGIAQTPPQLPVPMPPDLRIVPPSSDVSPERAAFSGIWIGRWDNVLDTGLAVEEITPPRVSAIYAWGVAPSWNINRAGWVRARRAEFVGADLRVTTDLFPLTYRMRGDGRLDAVLHGQQESRTIMTRVFPRVGAEPPPPAVVQQPSTQGGDCITEQVTFANGLLRLRGTVMRPRGEGRFPVVIYNHGSRIRFEGHSVVSFEASPIVPTGTPCPGFVADKRWVFFVPSRRGYGGSEGDRYSDIWVRFSASEVADAAVRRLRGVEADDVNAAYEFIKAQPYADGAKVAVTGASLGGIVSMFAAGRNPVAYRAVVNQAGAWSSGYEPLVAELIRTGQSIQAPILLQHGTQDQVAPLVASRQVADELNRLGKKIVLRTYSIGHSFNVFASGEVWLPDFVAFLEGNLK